MNSARAMGNSLDDAYLPDLLKAFRNNEDERVLGMMAWAMGRIGGAKAKRALNDLLPGRDGLVREEILLALERS